jgi:hypothetical protein
MLGGQVVFSGWHEVCVWAKTWVAERRATRAERVKERMITMMDEVLRNQHYQISGQRSKSRSERQKTDRKRQTGSPVLAKE